MSEINRRQFIKGSALVAGAAILTACSPAATEVPTTAPTTPPLPTNTSAPVAAGQPTNTPVPLPTATTAPADTATPAATAVPARDKKWPMGEVPRNRTLVYAYGNVNGIASPLATGYNHQDGYTLVWEPCAYYSAHADKTYLWLAESYQYDDKATTLTIKFRKGIMWSDGQPFTANDAVFSMTLLKTVDGLNRAVYYKTEMDKAEAIDDQTLKITFLPKVTDYRFFFKSLTFRFDLGDDTALMPQHIFKDIAAKDLVSFKFFDADKQYPVSTAAYGISQTSDQFTYFDLHPTWWAVDTGFVTKEPDVWRVISQLYQNDTLGAQQLINNEVDFTLDLRPMVIASLITQCDHVLTFTNNKPPYGYTDWWPISVYFNCAQKPTNDKRVRWAVSYALDRQQIVDVGWGGAGKFSVSPFPEFKKLNEYMAGIQDIITPLAMDKPDLKKSEDLMKQAGYTKNKDGYYADASGAVANFDLYGPVPLFGDIAPIVAQQLSNAGFKCDHKSPQDVWAALSDGRAGLFLFGHGGSTIDPLDTFMLYRKENITPVGQSSGNNLPRWSNDTFQKVTDQMSNTAMDDPAMKDLFHQGMAAWYDELPDAPIVQWYHRIPANITYWKNWPTVDNLYMNSALWHQTGFVSSQ
jgi:peptide/nickel transport system substrate-binding protein